MPPILSKQALHCQPLALGLASGLEAGRRKTPSSSGSSARRKKLEDAEADTEAILAEANKNSSKIIVPHKPDGRKCPVCTHKDDADDPASKALSESF